jgi:type VI secretion system secreted protein VgrG
MAAAADLGIRLESSSFPSESLQVHRIRGREAISRPYEFEIEIVSFGDEPLDDRAVAGAEAELVFEADGLEVRRFAGIVAEIDDRFSSEPRHRSYALRFVPRAHRLAMVETQEIFTEVSVPDLVRQKLELVQLGDSLDLALAKGYPKRDFIVQYRETDLDFLRRLTEHLGISFYFDQREGGERLVFTDHQGGFRRPDEDALPFRRRGEERDVFELQGKRRIVPAVYAVHDYNYRTPHLDLSANDEVKDGYAGGVVEYAGHFKTPDEAAALAKVRAEERQSTQYVYTGRSDLPGLAAGTRRTLVDHPTLGKVDLLVVEVEHEAEQMIDGLPAGRPGYRNVFKAVPADQTYRPPRGTPRPRMYGLASAIIDAGQPDGSKYARLDDQGRYLVRFVFDTGAGDKQRPSKLVRMAQPHAGPDYGMHFPLKPGTEVIVAFVDGDPDRPIIVGAVPNPHTRSPVDASNATVHRIKTQSGIFMDLVDEDGARS